MVIGIGGPSRSGKSTLSNLLVVYFRGHGKKAIVFHQDDFVFPETNIAKINGKTDWESPLSIDHELLYEVVSDFKKRFDIVIVDGFLAFYDPKLNDIFDKRIQIQISERTFFIRKVADTRWGLIPTWYMDHIWKSYVLNSPSDIIDIFNVSGEEEFDLKKIVDFLNA